MVLISNHNKRFTPNRAPNYIEIFNALHTLHALHTLQALQHMCCRAF